MQVTPSSRFLHIDGSTITPEDIGKGLWTNRPWKKDQEGYFLMDPNSVQQGMHI